MSNRTIEAILRLSSKLGSMAAFKTLSGNLAKVDQQAKAFNRSQGMIARGASEMHATLLRYAAPAALAYGAKQAFVDFAELERRMTRIGITADATSAETANAFKKMQDFAKDFAIPLDSAIVGLDTLVSSGRTMEEAMAFLPSVLRTAQASGAEVADIANTAEKAASALKLTASEMQTAFDIMVEGGKAGQFELRDMAMFVPELANSFASLGYSGTEGLKGLVAILQTIREDTGSASAAATQAQNIFGKMYTEETATKFKKMGIDLRREMEAAKAAGEGAVEAFVRISKEAVNGDLSKLPLLFTDQEFRLGMQSLMTSADSWERFANVVNDKKVDGAVLRDFNRVVQDSQASIDRMANSWREMKNAVGAAIAPTVAGTMDVLTEEVRKGQAVNAALDKSGMSEWDQGIWRLKSNFDPAMRDSKAWEGGYRSEADRRAIDAYGAYAKARSAAGAPAGGVSVPTSLPGSADDFDARIRDATLREQYSIYGRRGQSEGPQPSAWDRFLFGDAATPGGFRKGMQVNTALSDVGPQVESADEFEARITAALSRGGDDAATKLADSGQKFGDAATEKLRTEAASAGAVFGQAAADAFNRSARAPRTAAVSGNLGYEGVP